MNNQSNTRRNGRRGTAKRRVQQRVQLQTFKAITLVTNIPTSFIVFMLSQSIREELEEPTESNIRDIANPCQIQGSRSVAREALPAWGPHPLGV